MTESSQEKPPPGPPRGGFLFFRTCDTYFAAYLHIAGAKYVSADSPNLLGQVYFTFSDDGSQIPFKEHKKQFFGGGAQVPVLAYVQSLKFLREEIRRVSPTPR